MTTLTNVQPTAPMFFPAPWFFAWSYLNDTVKPAHNTGVFDNYLDVLKGERFTFEHPLILTYSILGYALYNSDWWMIFAAVLIYGAPEIQRIFSFTLVGSVTPISKITMILAGHLMAKALFPYKKRERLSWWPSRFVVAGLMLTWTIAHFKLWDPYPETDAGNSRGLSDIGREIMHGFFLTVAMKASNINRFVGAIALYDILMTVIQKYVGPPLFGYYTPEVNPTLLGYDLYSWQKVGLAVIGLFGAWNLSLLAKLIVIPLVIYVREIIAYLIITYYNPR